MSMDLAYILRGYEISNTAKCIWGLLDSLSQASARNGKPYTYISRQSIADRVGVCEKTVRTCLKSLKSVGLIAEKRMGRGLNNHIFVFSPKQPQEEKQKKVETADHSIYQSRTVNNPVVYTNTEKVIKNNIGLSTYPVKDDKGTTAPKGKPTPRSNAGERMKIRKKYRDYFREHFKFDAFKQDFNTTFEEADALAKIIDLLANTMASKGKIMVSGALLMPQQFFYVVKNISLDTMLDIIYKIPQFKNVKKPNAYLLACIYNEALQETMLKPYYACKA